MNFRRAQTQGVCARCGWLHHQPKQRSKKTADRDNVHGDQITRIRRCLPREIGDEVAGKPTPQTKGQTGGPAQHRENAPN